MNFTFLLSVCVVLLSLCLASGRNLVLAVPSCAGGSAYEEYKYDESKSFHAIMGLKEGVSSAEECAQLCIAQEADGCQCALYTAVNKMCQWRQTACDTSEMFVDAKPVSQESGLIAMCPKSQPKPQPKPQPTPDALPRWSQCGGKNYSGPRCCGEGDVCKLKNAWYAQCIPKDAARPLWVGTILRAQEC